MEDNDLLNIRREKIADLKSAGIDLYPNDIKPKNTTQEITLKFGDMDNDSLAKQEEIFSVAGRLMAVRNFGKAAFIKIQDYKGQIQGYIGKNSLSPEEYFVFKKLDIGDIIFISGKLFRTKTNELTIEAQKLMLLSKSIRPCPKMACLTTSKHRYRQRYLDLIANPKVKEIFHRRSSFIKLIRQFHG